MESKKRTFIVLMDGDNLFQGLEGNFDKLTDFSWLLDPIAERGNLQLKFVFFVQLHYPPVEILSKSHCFFPIVCLGEQDGKLPKQMDNADALMTELGSILVAHHDFTDLVIVSGDRDFNRLATKAKDYRKNVLIISARDALSGLLRQRFETMEFENMHFRSPEI